MGSNVLQQRLALRNTIFAFVFGIIVISGLGYLELGGWDEITRAVGSNRSSLPPADAFDPKNPAARRIELIKSYLVGDWHEPPIVDDSAASHTNYTFGADGSLRAWQCERWGEVSERAYKPYDRDGTVHTFRVEEDRYAADGKIFYRVIRGDGILWNYPQLQVDRQRGFIEWLPRGDVSKPIDRGHSTDCT